ncbi:unnamed protein product [Didymodactylos carnosus]|uniref:Uncharacterized protein n=1 Tax=Didymodactylos carnosus TaxID=1234261 RepID=A0A814I1T4_9BILA|nr:unnamed protein product [Didymodactylos carnosus]CAF1016018.1 unnamed protein product [Didymodactylos carnosus]CAF3604239.1 unnamed protein product [Didymodactylos carnosus]CAF3787529.1 unnamed protein product [Didymodactylos carnosus]
MTTNVDNDTCNDPFNSIDNQLEFDCQATWKGKHGTFPARFCVKISGTVLDVDANISSIYLYKNLFLRTCIVENIMDSTKSPDSTGNFRLKGFQGLTGLRMQGTITLCTLDGCNRAQNFYDSSYKCKIILIVILFYSSLN